MNASIDSSKIERACLVYMTARHQLVVVGSMCVAVRELESGDWLEEHSAIDEHVTLEAGVSNSQRLARFSLVAHSYGLRLVLGPVLAVTRPSSEICEYVAQLPRMRVLCMRPSQHVLERLSA